MSTQYKTQELSHVETQIAKLPISKHFTNGLQTSIEEATKDKGKMWALIIKLGIIGTIAYFGTVYILPPVFQALGKFAAVAATGIAAIATVIFIPSIIDWMRAKARDLKKKRIKADPFFELEKQEQMQIAEQKEARNAHGSIKALENDMHLEARANEKKAEELQTTFLTKMAKAEQIREAMKELEAKHGPSTAKGMDEYVAYNAQLIKVQADAQRANIMMDQAKTFVSKYGTRAAVMKKVSQNLTIVEAHMENKIMDFRATVEILKQDHKFMSKARQATDAAKKSMMFDNTWELQYAVDVVTTTIAYDMAQTSGSLKDLNMLTNNFDMDNDETFANLDRIAEQIKSGNNIIPTAKNYTKTDYALTHEDKLNSGGFGDIF